MKSNIDISPLELETLMKWFETLDPKPHVIRLTAENTGIGTHIRAEIEMGDGEGRFKDITDYESW